MSTPPRKSGFRNGVRRILECGKRLLKQLFKSKSPSISIEKKKSTPELCSPSSSATTAVSSKASPSSGNLQPSYLTNLFSAINPAFATPDNPSSIDPYSIEGEPPKIQTTSSLPVLPRLPSTYTTIISPRSDDLSSGNSSDVLMSGYEGLKTILNSIERASDVFPPLKSAVASLLGIIDIVETTSRNQKDREDLESTLRAFLTIINQHVALHQISPSEPFIRRIEGLSIAITHQISDIKMKQERSRARRVAQGRSDVSEIAGIYRTLLNLFHAFTIDTTLSTESVAQQILSHTLLDKLHPVPSADYNAYSPTQRHGCTEKTRESILAKLVSWAIDPTDTKIFWLNGMAGTGKTTIAYTFCEILDKLDMLGATFFCSRLDDTTASVNRIIPTIAYQLGQRYHTVHNSLLNVIERDCMITGKILPVQFREIIVGPLRAASTDLAEKPIVITIEALDECANQDEVNQLLTVISQYSTTLPVKFFITSRPERQIRRGFNNKNFGEHSRFILHDVEKDVVQADIELYAKERLEKIAEDQTYLNGWPPEHELKNLVNQAGNLFIYAATACSYVADGNVRERLKLIIDTSRNATGVETAALDKLYNLIITDAIKNANTQEREDIVLVLRAVVNLQRPLTITALGELFASSADRVEFSLSSLHSVIHVPSFNSLDDPVSTLHASFPDFISTESRAGTNYLERSESHRILALRCLTLMDSTLLEIIFGLTGQPPGLDLHPKKIIKERVSDGLAYACTYWAFHVTKVSLDNIRAPELRSRLLHFFDHNILRWIECLSVIGQIDTVIPFLRRLEGHIQTDGELWDAVMDTRRFLTENFEIIAKYSLETYCSALAWLPEESRIRKIYQHKHPWRVIVGRRMRWDSCEAVLVGHDSGVLSVAFSPDGSRIVSGSFDESIRIWNAETGVYEVELAGHTAWVRSVTFSPDGGQIASGSHDGTVRIWSVVTGDCETKLEGDGGKVYSVAFSPDGTQVVSGCDDGTVRIWNILTEELKSKMVGHSRSVRTVAFSADGSQVVSGSEDKTIRIWDASTEKCAVEIKGHSDKVRSVSFCPDGARVVSGSEDGKIGVWDAATGMCEAMLEGHEGGVYSVALSTNGRIVSGSYDKTVRIWSISTRQCAAILKGHTHWLSSVAFSPDGTRVISGSNDNSIRMWNSLSMGESEIHPPEHSDIVLSVAFSPDGSHIASGSKDRTIRVWSVVTGTCEGTLEGHSNEVRSVTFSPDGRKLLSGSDDNTARIWNVTTGASEVEIMGHTARLFSVAFSPDGLRIASGSFDYTVRIWSAKTGQGEFTLEGHSNSVNSVAFSPDGSIVASGSDDHTICLWNSKTGEAVAVLEGSRFVFSVAFSPKGDHIISRSYNKTVYIWSVKTQRIEAELVERDWTAETAVLSGADSNNVMSAKRAVLPDSTMVHWDSRNPAIIPAQSMPSLYRDGEYIRCTQIDQWCWIPPQFRDPRMVSYNKSKIVLGYRSGLVVAIEYAP